MTHVSKTPSRKLRLAAVSTTAVIGLTGLAACGDSAGPETGEVTTEDLQSLEEDLAVMDDRIGTLEGEMGNDEVDADVGADVDAGAEADEAVDGGLWEDGESLVGQQGTVSAAVSEVVTTTDVGSSFRIGGNNGEEIAVISANPPAELQVDDVVRVSGTVKKIQRDTFEEDFGVAADDLFDDVDGFFEEEEGNIGIAADRVEILQEQADE